MGQPEQLFLRIDVFDLLDGEDELDRSEPPGANLDLVGEIKARPEVHGLDDADRSFRGLDQESLAVREPEVPVGPVLPTESDRPARP